MQHSYLSTTFKKRSLPTKWPYIRKKGLEIFPPREVERGYLWWKIGALIMRYENGRILEILRRKIFLYY